MKEIHPTQNLDIPNTMKIFNSQKTVSSLDTWLPQKIRNILKFDGRKKEREGWQ